MNEEKLKPYVDEYKKVISEGNTDERYKLEALKNFQDNWNIEADDFKRMFDVPRQEKFPILS
ncbi:MAG: hypothetical protein U5P10_14965 [Spirochaetia bacterium]|nr:hypothetical protein [Spirochaetia bacterium]